MRNGKALVIAEAGVNHNGSLETAKRLADAALGAGADIVKFQVFKAETLVTGSAQKASYQRDTSEGDTQFDMLSSLELSYQEFESLACYCKSIGVEFLATAFDVDSIDFLERVIGVPFFKIPSGEVTNFPYLARIARNNKPIIMSTGMCELSEISDALAVLRAYGSGPVTLLHCTTEYPAPFDEVNLKAMLMLREKFSCEIGYSDHTSGIEIPIAAVALGATVVEKHFTLDRNMEGPDHKASLEPCELAAMVRAIRNVEAALGDGVKRPSASERKNIVVARKSIVAARDIAAGEVLTEENITTKRPGDGVSAMKWPEALGTRAIRSFLKDELIEL